MNTDETWRISADDVSQSLALAAAMGKNLRGGEVIELVSDVGGGKTTFTRGLAHGAGSKDAVSSPSFTLNNVYSAPKLSLYHFDFYRLFEPGIMRDELAEVIADPTAVTIVEWADIVEDVLPHERVTIRITATGENSRRYDITAASKLAYVMEGVA